MWSPDLTNINLAVASDHYDRRESGKQELPTLIVSPPSVTGHWVEEIEKFCGKQLSVLHYTGNNNERRKLQTLVNYNNVIVSSYEVIRNDSTFFHVRVEVEKSMIRVNSGMRNSHNFFAWLICSERKSVPG